MRNLVVNLLAGSVALLTAVLIPGGRALAVEAVTPELAALREAVRTTGPAPDAMDSSARTQLYTELLYGELGRLQVAIERWSLDHAPSPGSGSPRYPLSINELVRGWEGREPYIEPGIYPNPFDEEAADQASAICVPFGWSELAPGNFSYLTHVDPATGEVDSYVLVGYGPTIDSGWDLSGDFKPEGALVVLASGNFDFSQTMTLYDSGRQVHWQAVSIETEEQD